VQLIVERSGRIVQEFALGPAEVVIGRSQACDLVLAETGISRQHARVEPRSQGWALLDLGSTNGTQLNGQPLPAHQPHLLQPGDRITIGSFVLKVGVQQVEEVLEEAGEEPVTRDRLHPALLAAAVAAVILVLVGAVLLLVTMLGPGEQPVTPTVAGPMDQIMTALPVPTGFEEMITSVATLMPQGLPLPGFASESTPTPTPEAGRPRQRTAGQRPIPVPQPVARGNEPSQ
jgi:pSer/pThr/pTyr-binding forkhead associated (FHA) protein